MKTIPLLHQMLVSREFGGAAEIALQIARRCENAVPGQTRVWIPGEGRAAEKVRSVGLQPLTYDGEGIFSRSRVRSAMANLSTALRLRAEGRGLVHVHSPTVYGALKGGLHAARLKRIVHVQIEHAQDELRWALRRPPELIVTCARFLIDQVRQALPDRILDSQRIEAVPNAVDLDKFQPGDKREAKQRVGAQLDRPLLLMLANLSAHKGQETAIRAVAALKAHRRTVNCWLAGVDRSPERLFETKLRQAIKDYGVEDLVTLLGFRNDAPDLLRAADAVLLPSTHEGLPLTLLEAQACGVPIIAAPTAGIPEIIEDGRTGFLVDADDASTYARRIEQLLDDAARRGWMCEQARELCSRQHSWTAFYKRIADLYQEVLERPRTAY
jgi:starch synthase